MPNHKTGDPTFCQRLNTWLDKHVWSVIQFMLFLLLIFIIVVLPLMLVVSPSLSWPETLQWTWFVVMVFYVIVFVVAGWLSKQHHPLGILVNKENRLSFSRLQMLCWWVLLISTLLVVVGARLQYGWLSPAERGKLKTCTEHQKGESSDDCAKLIERSNWGDNGWLNMLNIVIPDGLLLAAGLSAGTAAAKASINGVKRNPSAKQASELDAQEARLGRQLVEESVDANRHLTKNPTSAKQPIVTKEMRNLAANRKVFEERHGFLMAAKESAINQIVQGNEVGNWEDLDWSKVQALLLTAILLVLYGVAIWRMLSNPDAWRTSETVSFPEFSGTLAALLTVSLAGYAGYQVADHTIVDTAAVKPVRERTTGMDEEEAGAISVGRVDKSGSTIVSDYSGKTFELGETHKVSGTFSAKRVVFKVPTDGKSVEQVSSLES